MQFSLSAVQDLFPELTNLHVLGEGGQKWVYSCETSGKPAVLKIIKPHTDLSRVQREIQAVASIQSSRVPEIYQADTRESLIGPLVWVLEEFVPGVQLRDAIQDNTLNLVEAKRLALEMLEALCAAEQARLIHRDVKPDNIVRSPDGAFWLLDFGIARHLDLESLTASGLYRGVGTPGYAPPEQFQNKKRELDSRADLFALGVTLFEALSGTNPFWEGTRDPLEVCRRVEQKQLPRLSLPDHDGSGFADFVHTLAQRRRNHRPETAKAALEWAREL